MKLLSKISKILRNIYAEVYEKRFFLLTACFAVLLNWAGHSFVYEDSYRFLTLDMIGTFVASVTLGTVWAIIVAITTPVVLSTITSPHFIYLAVINIAGAIVWGWLAETGNLVILNTKTGLRNNFKENLIISTKFILFAGVTAGLIISFASSVVKNVIFQNDIFQQPYSIYFTELFRNLFNITGTGFDYITANYIAETFIEIPNNIITVCIGSLITLTILKYNTVMLTQHYEAKFRESSTSWFGIFLSNISFFETAIFVILGYIYISTVKAVSNDVLPNIISKISTSSFNDILFLEMITIPLIIIIMIIVLKIFIPKSKSYDVLKNLSYLKRTMLNKKEFESDITMFLLSLFALSVFVVFMYVSIIVQLTGITPIKYYYLTSTIPANVSNLLWLIILIAIFILIDKYNNNITRNVTMENELIKKEAINEIEDSFDTQRQRLQALELNWSQDTIELLRSSRHDLVNQLEKTKNGLDELLSEIYEKIVKQYKDDILENQKKTREHIEDINEGRLIRSSIVNIEETIDERINFYNEKLKPYISIKLNKISEDTEDLFCYTNRLLFIAVNNIIDNSIFAMQKLILDDNFKPFLEISLSLEKTKKFLNISITDNAGGVTEQVLSKLYRQPVKSSKGQRFGEGTIHCAYFIGILNGILKAKNISSEGNTGLQTVISLPIYKEKQNG